MKYIKDNYNDSVQLRCVVCGETDKFDCKEDNTYIKCTNCGKEYFGGYDELVEYNQREIDEAMDAKVEEIKNDLDKELRDIFKYAFKGNKYIKIK